MFEVLWAVGVNFLSEDLEAPNSSSSSAAPPLSDCAVAPTPDRCAGNSFRAGPAAGGLPGEVSLGAMGANQPQEGIACRCGAITKFVSIWPMHHTVGTPAGFLHLLCYHLSLPAVD